MPYRERQEIQRDIIRYAGGAAGLRAAKVAQYLGVDPRIAREFLSDLPCATVGKSKIYLAKDIAKKLHLSQQRN